MTLGPSRANNRRTAAIASRSRAPSTPQSQVQLRPGPFRCLPKPGGYACIPQKRTDAAVCLQRTETIAPLRITDMRAKSGTPFRIFGTGSVGSQVLTGIPRLPPPSDSIPSLPGCSAVWSFRDWMGALELEHGSIRLVRILHAEIYPSVASPLTDTIKDRGQVRAMWHWARDLDATNSTDQRVRIPPGVAEADQAED